MKKFPLLALAYGLLLLIATTAACSSKPDTKALDSLTAFYKAYIQESSKFPTDQAAITALQTKHCTASLIASLATQDLEADPFLNAQDVDPSWADKLQITPDAKAQHHYNVCFNFDQEQAPHCIPVTMKEESGSWKIDALH